MRVSVQNLLWALRSASSPAIGDDPFSRLSDRLLADIGLRREQLPLYLLGQSADQPAQLTPRADRRAAQTSGRAKVQLALRGCG